MKRAFEHRLEKNAGRVRKRLAAYLQSPGGRSVHDARVSLRRLEAAFSLLPKSLRRKNARQAKACKAFFRASSRVRDFEIIRSRIASAENSAAIVASLDRRRKAEMARTIALARAIEKLPPFEIDEIDGKKLQARAGRVAGRLVYSIEERLPVAAGDSRKKKELHELRKDLKKLRYVLEIAPASSWAVHEKRLERTIKAKSSVVSRLEELQNLMGRIHDADVTVDYLRHLKRQEAGPILRQELAARRKEFEKFAKMFGRAGRHGTMSRR